MFVHRLLGFEQMIAVNVANGDDPGCGQAPIEREIPSDAMIPGADETDGDLVAGRDGAVEAEHGRWNDVEDGGAAACGQGAPFEKTATGESGFYLHKF